MNKLESNSRDITLGGLLFMAGPVGMYAFLEKCSGTAVVFSLKKFTSDPQNIALITSINVLFGIILAPVASWFSDKFGNRRKPIMLPGLTILAVCLFMLPAAKTLSAFILIIIIYQLCADISFNGPWDPLYADIVPASRRSLGMICNHYSAVLARLVFMFFLIGKFDKGMSKTIHGKNISHQKTETASFIEHTLTGEQIIYYSAAALVLLTILFLLFCVKEKPLKHSLRSETVSVKGFFKMVLSDKRYRSIYVLIFAAALMRVRLGSLWPLMVTEQFNLSKQSLGNIHAVTMITSLVIILPLAMLIIKKVNRWRIFLTCIIISTLHPLLFWITVKYFIHQPSVSLLIAFHVIDAIADNLGHIALWPLIFDIIPADKRGKMNAGLLLISGITVIAMSNVIAYMVKHFAHIAIDGQPDKYIYSEGMLIVFAAGLLGCILTATTKKIRL